MGKKRGGKAAKKGLSDKKNSRRALAAPIKKDNPFEKRKLTKKHVVVGQRLKSQESLGQARSAAIDQRKKTLLVEYQQQGRMNAFIDKRIGEQDETLSHEEKMLIRYQKEKQRKLLKKSLFSLDDQDEGLTHLGQSLSELDSFDDYMGSDDEEEVDGEIVSDYHFGGGIFQKVESDQPRNREEIMKEVIAKSKYFKQLHQREREESIALREELDDDIGSLLPHLAGHWKNNNQQEVFKDDFDILTRELANEARARPLNRLPTPEEIAQKQRNRLEMLEKERMRRMHGESDSEGEEDENEDEDEEMSDIEEENKKTKKKRKEIPKPLTEKELKLIEDSLTNDSIPFLISVPGTFTEMQRLFDEKPATKLRTIIARILASNNANLGPSYKDHMQRMFELTVEYFEHLVNNKGGNSENDSQSQILDILSQALFTLLPSIIGTAVPFVKAKLIEMHKALDESLEVSQVADATTAKHSATIWKPSEFFFFKVLSNLFPVTDFQHPVITPALLLMNRYLVYVPIFSLSNILTKLFLTSMIYHYVKPTSRFVPEATSFLQLILLGCLNQRKHSMFTSATRKMADLLILRKGSKREKKIVSQYQMAPLNLCSILRSAETPESATDLAKFQVLFVTTTLIGQFASLYENMECFIELFTPFTNLLHALRSKALPPQVQELVSATIEQIDTKIKQELKDRRPLTFKDLKPMPIRSLAPDFIENYVPGRDYDKNQERARVRALKKRVKSEKKGAMRELRKDSIFLENERMKKQLEDDKERKEKYNQIMHSLETEQHHFNVSKKEAEKARKFK